MILISSHDKETAIKLSKLLAELGVKSVTTTTFESTNFVLEEEYKLIMIDEQYAELVDGMGKRAVILCRQEVAEYYRNRNHKILILPINGDRELRKILGIDSTASQLIGDSRAMQKLRKEIARFAPHKEAVLIHGESGSGKELVAEELHRLSSRCGLFIPVNCSAIAEQLLESELFGHEKGAFTGADRQKKGLFEESNSGTLFLDEVADMPSSLQVKLLRVLQSGKVRRVGGLKEIEVDVRIIAASHKSLPALVKKGEFREDLFYRLNVLPITVPPLRDRLEDIPALVSSFLKGRGGIKINDDALDLILRHRCDWKGNIRQLQTIIIRAITCADTANINCANVIESLAMDSVSTPSSSSFKGDEAIFSLDFNSIPTLEEVKAAYYYKIRERFPLDSYAKIAKRMGVTAVSAWKWTKSISVETTPLSG